MLVSAITNVASGRCAASHARHRLALLEESRELGGGVDELAADLTLV